MIEPNDNDPHTVWASMLILINVMLAVGIVVAAVVAITTVFVEHATAAHVPPAPYIHVIDRTDR